MPDGYFDSLKEFSSEVNFLRLGREALLYASHNTKEWIIRKDQEPTILFPAFCCWSMSAPFEKSGWKLVYYRLNEDLTIDEEYLEELLKATEPQAVLTMNFYGSTSTKSAIARVKTFDERITVIEDFSHCTFCIKQIFDENVNFYVSSIRKSIGVCDGAVMLSKRACNNGYIQQEAAEFADKRYVAQTEKGRYNWSKDQVKKSEFLDTIRECEGIINNISAVRPISERALKMLALVNGEGIAFARRENMKHLHQLLYGQVRMVSGLERCFEGAPFSLPILVDDQDDAQRKLAQNGIYAPVLWPICEEARKVCKHSTFVADHMLSIPIDQRYNYDDMEDIAKTIIYCLNK
ncbi:hypothetical protein [Macellibacteroides fermentans]|uniref:hypothetical protein n=1 Tax=Macellibacteroides fermentans TaxID=879969 RepID=UPI00406C4F27